MIEAVLANGGKFHPKSFSGLLSLPVVGNIFYVHSTTGSNTANSGTTPDKPFATVAAAISAATANNNDVILVMPGHAETVTTAIAMSKAGVSLIGLGEGLRKPAITGNGTIDVINVTGANCLIENINFPAPLTDAATSDINIAAAGVTVRNTRHLGSVATENKVDIITITAAGDDFLIEGVKIYNTVVDCVAAISIEGACSRGVIRNCVIQGTFSTSCIMDEATALLLTIENNRLKNTKTTGSCMTFTTGNSTGVASFNHCSGRDTTIANNVVMGTGMDFFENRVTEQAALNGMILPAADSD